MNGPAPGPPVEGLEAIVEPLDAGGWMIRSPRVGIYSEGPRAGARRRSGDPAGSVRVLGRRIALVMPAGVDGLVERLCVAGLSRPVEFGQKLFVLSGAAAAMDGSGRETAPIGTTAGEAGLPPGCQAVLSPIDGVFYRAPGPGAAPFVQPGDQVEPGRTLGLIEAMKSFNGVQYGGAGLPERAEIVQIRAADGSEVRQGATLFVVRAAG